MKTATKTVSFAEVTEVKGRISEVDLDWQDARGQRCPRIVLSSAVVDGRQQRDDVTIVASQAMLQSLLRKAAREHRLERRKWLEIWNEGLVPTAKGRKMRKFTLRIAGEMVQ